MVRRLFKTLLALAVAVSSNAAFGALAQQAAPPLALPAIPLDDAGDTNKLNFQVELPEETLTINVCGKIWIWSGVPTEMAVLVNSRVDRPPFPDAFGAQSPFRDARSRDAWGPFQESLSVTLGPSGGQYDVWVGVRGQPGSAVQEEWERTTIRLERTPPVIVITNPTTAKVWQPMLQLKGYSTRPLESLRFDVTNAAGSVADQQGYLTPVWPEWEHPEWATRSFTDTDEYLASAWSYHEVPEVITNLFTCQDIALTNGPNVITLRAAYRSGYVSTNVYTCVLDYSGHTNPPTIALRWPQDGEEIASDTFSWRGWVNDFTATLVATLVTEDGKTNRFRIHCWDFDKPEGPPLVAGGEVPPFSGVVERTGKFWFSHIPLPRGTSHLSLVATDAAGNSSVTNISVVKSDQVITLDAVTVEVWDSPTGQRRPADVVDGTMIITNLLAGLRVTGTVSDPNCDMEVNGVKATVSADCTWNAEGVTEDEEDGLKHDIVVRAIPRSGISRTPTERGQRGASASL